jgi:hypothetical protein
MRDDRGSTIPLILAFFLLALLLVAGSIAAADAFVQQRDVQDICDGAATAAAASAVDLGRGSEPQPPDALRFADVQAAVSEYLARDPSRAAVQIETAISNDGTTLTLRCVQISQVAFGAVFGQGAGVRHVAMASVRAPVR